jgi:hypothetical protein
MYPESLQYPCENKLLSELDFTSVRNITDYKVPLGIGPKSLIKSLSFPTPAMFGLDQLLMQTAANGTIVAPTLFDQINATATSLSLLISTLSGIVVYAITTFRKVQKKELNERDRWMIELSKATQITAQKATETIGQSKQIMQIIYEANVPESERKKLEDKLLPLLKQTDERLIAANNQASMIKAKAVETFGKVADVDLDETVPREAKEIINTISLRKP